MVEQAPPAASHRSRTRLVVQGLLSLMLVVAIFYYPFKKLDPAQVWAAITDMTWLELATLGLLAVWNLCTYAFVWMTVTPGLGFWRAMVIADHRPVQRPRLVLHVGAGQHRSQGGVELPARGQVVIEVAQLLRPQPLADLHG